MNRLAIFRSRLLPISETFIRDQARALSRWQPVLMGFEEVVDGLPTPGIQREIVSEGRSWLERALRFWLWLDNPALVDKLKEQKVSLVHAHFGPCATRIWPSVKKAGLPLIVTLHGYDITINRGWWKAGLGGLRGRVYPRRLLNMAKDPTVSFIAVSEAIKACAIEYGIPSDKITVSYIGVDTARFRPGLTSINNRPKRVLFVGRMVEKKAPLLLVRAFAEVHGQVPDSELVMIGNGPLLEKAQKLASELEVPVSFLGACTPEEVSMQLDQSRVFCLPSVTARNGDREGLPISILESLACGVPVVASASGAVNEAVHSQISGIPVRENDIEGLRIALIKLLNESSTSLSRTARNYCIENFNLTTQTQKLEALYDDK